MCLPGTHQTRDIPMRHKLLNRGKLYKTFFREGLRQLSKRSRLMGRQLIRKMSFLKWTVKYIQVSSKILFNALVKFLDAVAVRPIQLRKFMRAGPVFAVF